MVHISQFILWCSLAFLAGTAAVPLPYMLIGSGIVVAYHKLSLPAVLLGGMVVLCFGVGYMRYTTALPDVSQVTYGQEVTFSGVISRPPINKPTSQKLHIATDAIPGKVYASVGRYPVYAYGDVVDVRCVLEQPEPFEEFAFDKYLARYGIYSLCKRASIRVQDQRQGNWLWQAIYDVRSWSRSQIRQLWPEPVASVILGVVLGIQDDIPTDIVEQFRISGTIHVLVVSGMHVVIIAQLLFNVLGKVLPRVAIIPVVGFVLFGFCVLTGMQASVVRAAIMGMLPSIAALTYRPTTAHHSIIVVAAIMVWQNPLIALHDMGFQLSFLATIGLLYFQKVADAMCWWIPAWFGLRETVSTTIAASIPTTPLIIAAFGTFSVVSVPANVVVVPVSTIMLFGGVAGMMVLQVWPWLAGILAHGLWVLVTLMLNINSRISSADFALLENLNPPVSVVLISYGLIVGVIIFRIKKS